MDTSKEYIKMCNCEEIQKQRESLEGDFYSPQSDGRICVVGILKYAEDIINSIWLPRQDQLQEMIDWAYTLDFITHKMNIEKGKTHAVVYFTGEQELNFVIRHTNFIADSFEKVLLRIIMRKIHNKIWDDNKWK